MPGFRKVNPGDDLSIPADDYNAAMDAASAYAAGRGGSSFNSPEFGRSQTEIWFQNKTGGTISQYAVLGYDVPIFGPDDNLQTFQFSASMQGKTPDKAKHRGRFAISQEPAGTDGLVKCIAMGLTIAKVNVGHASHNFADITDGSATELKSGFAGFAKILWKQSGTGSGKWALVLLGAAAEPVFGKPQTSLPAINTGTNTPGSATVDLWTGDSGAFAAASPAATFTGRNATKNAGAASELTMFLPYNGELFMVGGGGTASPRRFKALLNGALHKADANATIDTVTSLVDGQTAPTPTTAANYLRWAGNDNDPVFIVEDTSSGTPVYLLESVAWDVVTPVTDSLVDAPNLKLQKKTTDFIGKANAAQSAAIDVDAGQSC